MKKRSLLSLALVAVGLFATAMSVSAAEQAPATPHQIALIDMAHIFKNYEKFKDQTTGLQKAAEEAQANAQGMVEQGKRLQEQLAGLTPDSPDAVKIENQLIELRTKLQTFQQVEQREIVRKQADLYKQIYLEVQNVVGRYASYYHYTLVIRFDRQDVSEAAQPQAIINGMNRQVVYHQPKDDITQPVLDFLNNEYRKTASAK